jgi:hypothetical protein
MLWFLYQVTNGASKRKRKEGLRTIGMGGIRNTSMQMSSSNARGETRAHAFLHVPIPTALRSSLSSTSLLTIPFYHPGTNHASRVRSVCIYRPLLRTVKDGNIKCMALQDIIGLRQWMKVGPCDLRHLMNVVGGPWYLQHQWKTHARSRCGVWTSSGRTKSIWILKIGSMKNREFAQTFNKGTLY